MLTVGDLIDINYIPAEAEISLDLLKEFYENYLCKRIFIFTLKNGETVKLFFRDTTEIFHISGIDHIYEDVPMDGTRFISEIESGNIDLAAVKSVNPNAYKDYEDRICSMACLDTIIKNCEYLFYPGGKIPQTEVKVKYLLLKGLNGKNLHLGIDTYKKGRPYFTRTLLVTEGNSAGKFIEKADERLRVVELVIKDKDTDKILIHVKREEAEKQAIIEVERIAQKWLSCDFPKLIEESILNKDIEDKIGRYWYEDIGNNKLKNLENIHNDLVYIKENLDNMEDDEWRELLFDVLKDLLTSVNAIDKLAALSDLNSVEYQEIYSSYMKREQRDNWKRMLLENIEQHKLEIKEIIDALDPYWSGKIIGESIRKYEGDNTCEVIKLEFQRIIEQKCEDMTRRALFHYIYENRENICIYISKNITW
ncbi:hypothetical protein [Anaerocolumna xylanovorans]|uniref:Phage-Barnase-EndoU-ColicinE5/D-RelE like nuclease 4 domain-containing protein n=1 Tax=Anaerocolumna xylanovorans DSM 12503 TaxID=1121345 RepID=A0A1M7YLE9_9FIRM|nr:hypothetical protein [Anaerocolumna xylanovorans]SHO53435.1 hypothetical protein SAMN02745217_04121 [Anaerocolumna xylanovorans DSM 12503]